MANPHRGEVSFEAEGTEYTLQYSNNALVELEDRLDRGIVDISSELLSWAKDPKRIRLGTIRAVLWAGLREHHPEVDLRAAGEIITKAGGVLEITGLIGEAFSRAFPAPEKKGSRPRKRGATNGTGPDS